MNLKIMIRKYFEQEHSIVEADTKEVVVASAAVITFILGVSTM
jgi:hypothetical protein